MATEHPFATVARDAQAHLIAACPRLGPFIEQFGPCTLAPTPDLFAALVRAVLAQLIWRRAPGPGRPAR